MYVVCRYVCTRHLLPLKARLGFRSAKQKARCIAKEQRAMKDTEFNYLLKEAIQLSEVRSLIGDIAKKTVDPNIILLTIPYIENIIGKLLMFIIGEQPRELLELDYFQRSWHKPLLEKLSNKLG